MGARGPLPKSYPSNVRGLKAVTGNVRSGSGVKARSRAPVMPDSLSEFQQTLWKSIVRDLEPLGLLSPADGLLLHSYCQAAELQADAYALIQSEGSFTERRGETVKHPAVMVWYQATAKVESIGKALGLSPESRLRMPTPPPDLDDSDLD